MPFTSVRSWRALLVSIHVIASVCWLGLALALVALLTLSASAPPGETKIAAAAMADVLDLGVLGFSAMIAALTGFGLATVTSWGYFHHWWVSTRFVLTLAQIAAGTLVIGQALPTVTDAARAGADGAALPAAIGLGFVAGGLAFQVWLSVAKPGGRTPRGRAAHARPPTAPVAVVATMVVLPLIDISLHIVAAIPLPVLTPIGLIIALVVRRRATVAGTRIPTGPAPGVLAGTVVGRVVVTPAVVSLHGDPADRSGDDVAVLREPAGRGGSIEVHELQEG